VWSRNCAGISRAIRRSSELSWGKYFAPDEAAGLLTLLCASRTRYRELVGTAETIVSMNKEIQDVESILTDVGRRCNPRLVEKKHQHARRIKSDAAENSMSVEGLAIGIC
jgi:hypothetical protein